MCRTLGQHRSTQRKVPCGLPDEARLTEDIIALSEEFGRYGYRMITGMLNNSGRDVNYQRPLIAASSDERGRGRTDFGDGRG